MEGTLTAAAAQTPRRAPKPTGKWLQGLLCAGSRGQQMPSEAAGASGGSAWRGKNAALTPTHLEALALPDPPHGRGAGRAGARTPAQSVPSHGPPDASLGWGPGRGTQAPSGVRRAMRGLPGPQAPRVREGFRRVVSPFSLRDVFRAAQEQPSGRASLARQHVQSTPAPVPQRARKAGSRPGEGSRTPETPTTAASPGGLEEGRPSQLRLRRLLG